MAPDEDWFTVHAGADLEQGDLLLDCPRFSISGLDRWPIPADAELTIQEQAGPTVILTQSCDLQHEKVRDVLLARVIPWTIVRQTEVERGNRFAASTEFRRALVQGNVPGLSLLRRFAGPPDLAWSLVDFHTLFVLPKSFLIEMAAVIGPRLRMRSPYREHLAQAFARYFMRVGLPHDADEFIDEGRHRARSAVHPEPWAACACSASSGKRLTMRGQPAPRRMRRGASPERSTTVFDSA
jgi:hypothetical protein